MVPRPSRSSTSRSLGQSLVEMALVTPILMLLIMGLFDFGRVVASQSALSHAAQEGARAGIFTSATDTQIRAAVNEQAGILGEVKDADIAITPTEPRTSGNMIEVELTHHFTAITPMITLIVGENGITLTASAKARVE